MQSAPPLHNVRLFLTNLILAFLLLLSLLYVSMFELSHNDPY